MLKGFAVFRQLLEIGIKIFAQLFSSFALVVRPFALALSYYALAVRRITF